MDRFESEHRKWLDEHLRRRTGVRRRRLEVGHGHGEITMLKNVWHPALGHFEYLHPEYEVRDFLEGRRFIDFAYIRPPIRIAIEVDGIGAHLRDISRKQFCDERIRHMHLTLDGWIVIRIGYDDLVERPKVWQQLLLQLIGRLFGAGGNATDEAYDRDRETVKLALRLGRPIRLLDIQGYFGCGYRTSRQIADRLQECGLFQSVGGGPSRSHAWKLDENHPRFPKLL